MKSIEEMKQFLEKTLSAKRFAHSLGVMDYMRRAAKPYGLDPEKAALAGLLHDKNKEESDADLVLTLKLFNPKFIADLDKEYHINRYLHGPAAACEIPFEFFIDDREILLAIHQHNGGFAKMPLLSQCLHIVDVLVPTKPYAGRYKLEKLFLAGQLNEANLLLSDWVFEVFQEENTPIHPAMKNLFEHQKSKVRYLPSDFFSRQ